LDSAPICYEYDANKGRVVPMEHIQRMNEDRNFNIGFKHSEESTELMRQASLATWVARKAAQQISET
jgi:hypothetical protein